MLYRVGCMLLLVASAHTWWHRALEHVEYLGTVGPQIIVADGHNCWVMEAYLLGV